MRFAALWIRIKYMLRTYVTKMNNSLIRTVTLDSNKWALLVKFSYEE